MKRLIVLTVLILMVLATPASAATWQPAAVSGSVTAIFAYVGGDVPDPKILQVGITSFGAPHKVKWESTTDCYRGSANTTRDKKGSVVVGKGKTKWRTIRNGARQDLCAFSVGAGNANTSNFNGVIVEVRMK